MAQEQAEPDYFYRVHANPRSDSRENLYLLQAYIPQDNGRAKIGDVLYVGTPERCRELMDQLNTGGADAGGRQGAVCQGTGTADTRTHP